jgi:hypothetical protein
VKLQGVRSNWQPCRCSICGARCEGVQLIQHLHNKHHKRCIYLDDNDGSAWPTDEQVHEAGLEPLILADEQESEIARAHRERVRSLTQRIYRATEELQQAIATAKAIESDKGRPNDC